MDKKELALAIDQICEEKGLTKEDVKATIEDALAAAFRKDFGDKKTQNIKTSFNLETAEFDVFDVKEVVEDELKEKYEKIKAEIDKLKDAGKEITPELIEKLQGKSKLLKHTSTKNIKSTDSGKNFSEDKKIEEEKENEKIEEEKKFNPRTMISFSDAKKIAPNHKIGDTIITKLEVPAEFGRMAAQTAKQVIIQKIRETEREGIFDEFKNKVGELVVGTVQRKEGRVVLVDFGNTTAIILPNDQISFEKYNSGDRMKFYVKSVTQTPKGPEILVSRSHVEILRKLFKLEVPEINEGTVVIKSVSRDAGSRAKVAVMSKEESLDPIGSCIGQRGSRIQTIINELGGEKVDIIEWDEDEEKFIANALAPAKVDKVEIVKQEEIKIAKAYVKEDQYSLAIGKGGQNVRLAAQLVGVKIDVVMKKSEDTDESQTDTDSSDEKKEEKEDIKDIKETKEIDKKQDEKEEEKKIEGGEPIESEEKK